MHAGTRWSAVGLAALVALAPAGALAKVKKKTAASIHPGAAALALDAAGVPHLAYQSPEYRPFHAVRPEKKFLSEQIEEVSDAGSWPALGVDSTGRVHVAFHAERTLPEYAQALVYGYSDGAGWTTEEVKNADAHVGGYATSLALDADDQVHLLYTDGSGNLAYAQQEDVGWEFHALGFAASWFRTTSLGLDADGNAHACYVNGSDARYATNASGDWTSESLDPDGQLCSLALDGDGRPWVAVLSPAAVALHHHDGVAWSDEIIVDFGAELPGFTIGPDGIALALAADGRPYLVVTVFASFEGKGAEFQLFVAHDGEEWLGAVIGTKDEGFDPVLRVGPDGVLHGIWRSGGEDKAKLSYFQGTFPDLAGSWSGVAETAGVVTGTFTVGNEGSEKSKSAPIALYLSSDAALDGGDALLPAKLKVGGIKPGLERAVAVEVEVAGDPSGQYLIAVIDPEKDLEDLDRSDNTVAVPIP